MLAGQKVVLLESLVNWFDHDLIGSRSRGHCNVGNEMRRLLIADFGQMHFLSHPCCTALFAVASLWVVGRTEKECRRRDQTSLRDA